MLHPHNVCVYRHLRSTLSLARRKDVEDKWLNMVTIKNIRHATDLKSGGIVMLLLQYITVSRESSSSFEAY